METAKLGERILLRILKDFSSNHTVSTLSKELKISRSGIWKVLRKLEKEGLILLESIGNGKTSTNKIKLNWENIIVEKALALSLTQEALKQKRWRAEFIDLEREVDFSILYGSILHSEKEANDIDILNVSQKNKLRKIGEIMDKKRKFVIKKIHAINLTSQEFKDELKSRNKAIIDAVKRGVVLYGQERFIKFLRSLQT